MDRFLLVKERELTAHLAAVELHEQTAELQDRMGHPQRAAEARTQAEQAASTGWPTRSWPSSRHGSRAAARPARRRRLAA